MKTVYKNIGLHGRRTIDYLIKLFIIVPHLSCSPTLSTMFALASSPFKSTKAQSACLRIEALQAKPLMRQQVVGEGEDKSVPDDDL